MTQSYYEPYRRITPGQKGPKQTPDRQRQNALSAQFGWLTRARDFDWLEKNIPCQAACPAGTDIPGYLEAVADGRFDDAYLINLRDNVFPAVLGRVCTRPCEPACRHGWEGLGEPVAICFSKRSAADFMKRGNPVVLEPVFPSSGRQVAVIGSGAAGLAAARELALFGHRVQVFEQHTEPGGMMVQGIPAFRLPRDIVRREIDQIVRCGVEIRCGVSIGKDISLEQLSAEYDAVVIAAGTMKPHMPAIPGRELSGVHAGLGFLQNANAGAPVQPGKRVVVIGGGFTAVDCARMARRLGAEEVRMVYRRTEEEMYITPGEVHEMVREGIVFETRTAPVAIEGNGRVERIRLIRTEPDAPGPDGRRGFHAVPGSEFELEADTVLLATGQERDDAWLGPWKDRIAAAGVPSAAGDNAAVLFAAGDFLDGAGSLIDAVAGGKRCAHAVDAYLTGRKRVDVAGFVEDAVSTGRTREMDAVPRQSMPVLPDGDRDLEGEVERGFDEESARREAGRCYLCNFKFEIDNDLCIYCDRCLKVKPVENCIVKISRLNTDDQGRISGYVASTGSKDYNMLYIDQSQCIRCGACRDVCPVECITLQKVTRKTVTVDE